MSNVVDVWEVKSVDGVGEHLFLFTGSLSLEYHIRPFPHDFFFEFVLMVVKKKISRLFSVVLNFHS